MNGVVRFVNGIVYFVNGMVFFNSMGYFVIGMVRLKNSSFLARNGMVRISGVVTCFKVCINIFVQIRSCKEQLGFFMIKF